MSTTFFMAMRQCVQRLLYWKMRALGLPMG